MKLIEGKAGQTYLVSSVSVEERLTRRLEALGVNEETPIMVLDKKGSGSLIIKVRGTRLALGRRIAEGITVEESGKSRRTGELPKSAESEKTGKSKESGGTAARQPAAGGDGRKAVRS